jgi:serine/threonine protein kinase
LYETIKACKYNFNDPSWKNVTDEAKDFISKILVADPEKRMSSSQMMSHPWMLAELDSNTCLDHTKSKLTKYVTKRKEDSKRELLENDQDQDDL